MTGRRRWSRARVPDQDSRHRPPRGPRPAPGPPRAMGIRPPCSPPLLGCPHWRGPRRAAGRLEVPRGWRGAAAIRARTCWRPRGPAVYNRGPGEVWGAPPAARPAPPGKFPAPQQPPRGRPPPTAPEGPRAAGVPARGGGFGGCSVGVRVPPKPSPAGNGGSPAPPRGFGVPELLSGRWQEPKGLLWLRASRDGQGLGSGCWWWGLGWAAGDGIRGSRGCRGCRWRGSG